MSVTYGFYNSLNSDRLYNALDMGRIFDGIISDGVYASIGDRFKVLDGVGMSVTVGTGRAWFNHTWTLNDSVLSLDIQPSNVNYGRYDAVVLEVNTTSGVRANSIKVVTGTPSSNPVYPTMIKSGGVYQYPLAYITVAKGATSILPGRIKNCVGTSECPYVTGVVSSIHIDDYVAQWEEEWEHQLAEQNQNFATWFNSIRDMLDEDVAGQLAQRILSVEDRATALENVTPVWSTPAITGGDRVKNIIGGYYRDGCRLYIQLQGQFSKTLAKKQDHVLLRISTSDMPPINTTIVPLNMRCEDVVGPCEAYLDVNSGFCYLNVWMPESAPENSQFWISGQAILGG